MESEIQCAKACSELYKEKKIWIVTDEILISIEFYPKIKNTYGCLSNLTFSQFVEINEKFFHSDSIFGNESL